MYETSDVFLWKAFEYTEHGRAHYTQEALDHLHAQVADGKLRAALTPDYPLGCRRVLNSDGYYPALQRENVTLETGAIAAIEPTGVRLADGRRHELDMLVHATGFETTGWKWSLDVVGRGGASLRERWADAPRAYLGIMVPDFPKMFVLYGPNTNLGHHSITFMLECQIEFILMATAALDARGCSALEPTRQALEAFDAEVQALLASTSWADPACNSWYKRDDGRIVQN